VVFIQGTRFPRGGGTNREGAAGSGRFRVGKQPMKLEQIECSETSANNNQTPGKYPKEYIQESKHGESLKSSTEIVPRFKIASTLFSYILWI